jgi:hypothetical protein
MTMKPTTIMRAIARRSRTVLPCVAAAALVQGCSDRPPTGVLGETTTLLQRVRADFKALNMSPGDSRKLTPVATDAGGAKLTNGVGLRYTSSSTKRVTVDADGTIHALAITEEPVSVIIAGTQDQVTQFDTVLVNVIDPPAAPATKFVMFFDGDSLGLGAGNSNYINGAVLTAAGDTLPNILVVFTTKDPRVATPNRYQRWTWIYGISPGQTWLYGTATVGATTFRDSLPIHVGWAGEAYMGWTYLSRWGYSGLNVVIQPKGIVYFSNWNDELSQPVIFDDPAAAEAASPGGDSGNIPAFKFANNPRMFSTPGTYTWRSKDGKGNAQVGQVIVKSNPF